MATITYLNRGTVLRFHSRTLSLAPSPHDITQCGADLRDNDCVMREIRKHLVSTETHRQVTGGCPRSTVWVCGRN